jgi:hypothetical protein
MPRKEFEAFTRLDASDVNTYLMDQSVMTFADSGARGSAIATPLAGMITYLQDSNTYETYSGSSYSPLVPSGLQLVKSQTIGTAASSVVVSDVFSANYDNYRVVIAGATASVNVGINIQFGSATSAYFGANQIVQFGGTSSTSGQVTGSFFTFASISVNNGGGAASIDIYSPFKSERTGFSGTNVYYRSDLGAGFHRTFSGFQNSDTSFTGFTINVPSATLTGGQIDVYGYKKA